VDVSDDLDRRFLDGLRKAVEEAYQHDNPQLARALQTAGEYMRRSRQDIVKQLEELGVYSFTPQQYQAMLDVIAAQMVKQARERADAKSTDVWQGRAARWGLVIGVSAVVVPLVANQVLSIITKLHP
jgi:hypothetical protein